MSSEIQFSSKHLFIWFWGSKCKELSNMLIIHKKSLKKMNPFFRSVSIYKKSFAKIMCKATLFSITTIALLLSLPNHGWAQIQTHPEYPHARHLGTSHHNIITLGPTGNTGNTGKVGPTGATGMEEIMVAF